MNISIVTKDFKDIQMTATDIGFTPSSINIWNGELNEKHYRTTFYDDFREFCNNVVYKKPNKNNVAVSRDDDYYLLIPRENIEFLFVHDAQ